MLTRLPVTGNGRVRLESWCGLLTEALDGDAPIVLSAQDWGAGWDRDALRADALSGFGLMRRLYSLCDQLGDRGDVTMDVHGRCIGPGFAVALHADAILAPPTPLPAWVGTRETIAGLIPLLDTTHRLLHRLPPSTAMAMLVGDLLPASALTDTSRSEAEARPGGPPRWPGSVGSSLPPGALDALTRLIEGSGASREDRHELELTVLMDLLARPDAESIGSRYFDFSGPALYPPATAPGLIAVVGTGQMGTSIAAAAAAVGFPTAIVGRTGRRADQAVAAAGVALERLGQRGPLRIDPGAARARLRPVIEVPADAFGVVEAVIEDSPTKRRVLSAARVAAPDAWLSTTSTSLPLDGLGPDVALTHFAYPAETVPVVEVAMPATFGRRGEVLTWLRALGKRPIEVASVPGYVVSRLLYAYMNEGLGLYAEQGIDAATIDGAARAGGFPLGPLSIFDSVGLDLVSHIAQTVLEPAYGSRFVPHPALAQLIAAGRLGRKVDHGFYRWTDGRPLPDGQDPPSDAIDAKALADRLGAAVVDEAARCVEDGIASAEDVDVLAVACARCFPAALIGPGAAREDAEVPA